MSEEKRREVSRKAALKLGLKYGKVNYAKTLGTMTQEEKRQAHIKSAIVQGRVLFSLEPNKSRYGFMDEQSYVIMLKESGKFSWREIEEETNKVYENNRNLESLRTTYNSDWRHYTIKRDR